MLPSTVYTMSPMYLQRLKLPCPTFKEEMHLLSDFINLAQVHNFTVSAQDIFAFRRLSLFTVSFLQEFCKY